MKAYAWPVLLCLASTLGLILALVLDGVADVAGVALAAAPLGALGWHAWRARES